MDNSTWLYIGLGFSVILLIFLWGGVLVLSSTLRREGKWGINVNSVKKWQKEGVISTIHCPVCDNDMKNYVRPRTLHEILWGGGRCGKCGASLDKWGDIKQE